MKRKDKSLATTPRECTVRRIIVAPYEIHTLRFLLEGYDGLAVVSTDDPQLGLVRLSIAPGCEDDVDRILAGEEASLKLRCIEPLG